VLVEANAKRRIPTHPVHHRSAQQSNEMSEIRDLMQKLQQSSATDPHSRLSYIETTLIHYAHDIIVQGTTIHEASLVAESITNHHQSASNSGVANWVQSLEAIRQDQKHLDVSKIIPRILPALPYEEEIGAINTPCRRKTVHGGETVASRSDESDDDLDTDLFKAALDTGTKAFKAREWKDAQSLLGEALRLLQKLTLRQRMFCDILDLHHKLAICTYHTQEPADAEEALISLIQQTASTDKHLGYIYDATHLLSQLHIRTGQIDRARIECEKALQARRRLLGKRHDDSLESLALMAHIYVLQDNRALAKSYLSMIPETKREDTLAVVEASLGPTVEHLDFSSLLTTPVSQQSPRSEASAPDYPKSLSGSTIGLGDENRAYGAMSTTNSPAASPYQSKQSPAWGDFPTTDTRSFAMSRASSAASISEARMVDRHRPTEGYSPKHTPSRLCVVEASQPPELSRASIPTPLSIVAYTQPPDPPPSSPLTRKQILEKVGCQPRDRIEEAVCNSDMSALTTILSKKKSSWRFGLRKRVRSERVTALHFAALFNELAMARSLLDANFNVNEIPFGYTSSLSPLHFAIGARQVDMVDFLIANGAKPCEPETWSTLAGQLLSRSWLLKTLSGTDRETASSRILAIMSILLRSGWDVNEAIDSSGRTALHQAVGFWTGAYRWDLEIRASVTAFLCECGADPGRRNKEGKTPWDLAVLSDHRDIMELLGRGAKELDNGVMEPVELPGVMS
jgi:tetratricopeptide (TPR) repeat protein